MPSPPRIRPPQPAPPAATRPAAPTAAPATALRTAPKRVHRLPFPLKLPFRRTSSPQPLPSSLHGPPSQLLPSFQSLPPFLPLPSFLRRQESTPPRRRAPAQTSVAASAAALLTTLILVAATAIWLAACSEPAPPVQQQPAQPEPEPPPTQVLVLSESDLGGHLKATEWAAGVMEWIAELQDPTLAALPRRALWNDGRIFVPAADSPSGETFWLHVFTDESPQSAQAWVRYLASLPPDAVLNFTSPEHRLVEAVYTDPPNVGSAALAVELLHGNAGGRFRTEVIVFAQQAAIVILRNSRAESRRALTNLRTIATQISARLAAPTAE